MNSVLILSALTVVHLSCQTIIPGSRLLDFPNPDFTKVVSLSNKTSFQEVKHNFGSIPFHVRVYAQSKDGGNAGFAFEGTGACQNDGRMPKGRYGGMIFAYNKDTIKIWSPKRTHTGSVIFVGEGWGGNKFSQTSFEAKVTVQAWRTGPLPTFEKIVEIDTRIKRTFKIPHMLSQLPELISVRVSSKSRRDDELYFHAVSASQTSANARTIGGVIFGYNATDIVLWTPNKPKSGCIGIGKKWGNGRSLSSEKCYINIRLWINAFPPPVFQSDWTTVYANQQTESFLEIRHGLRLLPTYVRVQYRTKGLLHPLIFDGSGGSVQATQFGQNRYGGVQFAYDKLRVRIWLPSSTKKNQAYIIFIGDGWGDRGKAMYNVTAELRVQVFADKCSDESQVVDAQGFCRDIKEVELVQDMGPWEKCSNPCGTGVKMRRVQGCTGRSLQNVINCNFKHDYCGFEQSNFKWLRSMDKRIDDAPKTKTKTCKGRDEDRTDMKNSKFMREMMKKEPYFIRSITKPCVDGAEVKELQGHLVSGDLGGVQGCILQFKYAADSYYGRLSVELLPGDGKDWREDIWIMEDDQVQSGIWHSAYLNIETTLVKSMSKFRFTHKLPYSSSKVNSKCPGECHPIFLTNITLKCEKDDLYKVSEESCEQKKLPLASCVVNAFKPFSKGVAWSVDHAVQNYENDNIGPFVTANGSKGDLIATYVFNIKISNEYHLWIDSFAKSNKTNGLTIDINDREVRYDDDLIYNEKNAMWLPSAKRLPMQAGTHTIKLYQREKFFRYRNLMIAPRNIQVWSSLGMQSFLIPDSNFKSLSGIHKHLVFSRLNGKGVWAPTDNTKGRFYLEIQLPDLALINKISTQGGRSLAVPGRWTCKTDSYKVKFSLDRKGFAYYRLSTYDRHPHEFIGNTGNFDQIGVHNFKYALVARAIRFYPQKYSWSGCLRIEMYGYYMVKGMCPTLLAKTREKNCTGDGACRENMNCVKDKLTHHSKCDCISGYHGNSCNMSGCDPNPCKNDGLCVNQARAFKCDCAPGFYGKYCENKCPPGKYGKHCDQTCSCPDKEYCNPKTGHCSCFRGYHGTKCDKPCTNGTFGQDCLNMSLCNPPMTADHVTGECYCPKGFSGSLCNVKCVEGTYGRNCTKKCSCLNGGKCNKTTGACDCLPGWLSSNCQLQCPKGRYGKKCSQLCHHPANSACDPVSGLTTCAAGYMGRFCKKTCPPGWHGENCAYKCQCNSNNIMECKRDTGECVCKPGWRGESCNDQCEDSWGLQCKHKCLCKNGGKCDGVTGRCTCLAGHNGTHCELPCPDMYYGINCARHCDCIEAQTEKCDPTNGVCSCMAGFQGKQCGERCHQNKNWGKNCRNKCNCLNDAPCDLADGFCFCERGYEGLDCGKSCDAGTYGRDCAETCKCQNGAVCGRFRGLCDCAPGYVGGYCQKACDDGYYGKHCASKCKCVKEHTIKCNHINGSCTCKPGFQGEHCQKQCDDGYYGAECKQTCYPCRHSFDACNKINGTCSCIDGFTGLHCMDDCDATQYGRGCSGTCSCHPDDELCDNLNGHCYKRRDFTFIINLAINRYTFNYLNAQEELKENLSLLIWNCLKLESINPDCMVKNASDYSSFRFASGEDIAEQLRQLRLINTFYVRILDIKSRFSSTNSEVTSLTMTLLNNTVPVNGSSVAAFLAQLSDDVLSKALDYEYYREETYSKKRPPIPTLPEWIVIGVSSFGGLLAVFLICLICRCTKRVPYPPPFQKVRRDSKDFEMQPSMTCNSHLLAFENPYYDVIAAMGLDDDIEEDYYNPLYDNMLELQSDSETEPEDMYYSFRNNNYHRGAHYPYDKDSGFSSGTLM